MDAGTRFLAAFNEIESHFRKVLGADEHVEFASMAREYAATRRLPWEYRDALSAFGRLRNAISHERYYGGRPIAQPVTEVVEQIERLRDKIMVPPAALSVLGSMDVFTVGLDEQVSVVLEYVRRFDYSQVPVYDNRRYVGLLTTNAIARWLADQLAASGGLAEDEAVGHVLEFAESHERALHVARTITAAEAIHRLSSGGQKGRPAAALIITQSGSVTETPLAIVVTDDLPMLSAAVVID